MQMNKMEAKIAKKKVKLGSKSKNSKKNTPKLPPHPRGSYNPQYVYSVQLENQTWEDAKILDIQRLPNCRDVAEKDLTPEHYEYYVHFFNLNRYSSTLFVFLNSLFLNLGFVYRGRLAL